MSNKCTFKSIFMPPENEEEFKVDKIVIPIIQRDYAQGRDNSNVNRIRARFLDALYTAIAGNNEITLDFVYGDIHKNVVTDENGDSYEYFVMTPLDGQQRLTTLFLLHWYASKKGEIPDEECEFLKKFSYETRYSARDFCKKLVDSFEYDYKDSVLSKDIINQWWFPLDWKKDPTISSMLVMLDAIDEKFNKVEDLWEKLDNIKFYFLVIEDMGLTDELYIKMNSRGKPLTLFEHFKAELEKELRNVNQKIAERILEKIDREWTDLLWLYRNSDNKNSSEIIIDDKFIRYIRFICDIIFYKEGKSPKEKNNDEFELIQTYFSKKENIETLEDFFDCWGNVVNIKEEYGTPRKFLESFMSNKHEKGKIVVKEIDIFEDCLCKYLDGTFPLSKSILLYAIIIYLKNFKEITLENFARRIRIVNNLIQNSENEISDRADNSRITCILEEVDKIILKGKIDDNIGPNFNKIQLEEEKEKISFIEKNPEKAEVLYELEDNELLYGQIGIIGVENIDYANRFESLFKCQWDKIDCALMSIGDYGQKKAEIFNMLLVILLAMLGKNSFIRVHQKRGLIIRKKFLLSCLKKVKLFLMIVFCKVL